MEVSTASPFGQHRHTLLVPPHQTLIEALGLSPETRLIDAGLCSPLTIRGGRRWVQLRNEAGLHGRDAPIAGRAGVALTLVPQAEGRSENQHQQADDHQKADQKNDAYRATEKLEHAGDSFGWVHLLRLGYRRFVPSCAAKADG